MFKYWLELVHNHENGYLDWLFHWNIFSLKESTSIMSDSGKGSHLKNYLKVHSMNSDQVFLSIP